VFVDGSGQICHANYLQRLIRNLDLRLSLKKKSKA
jgi:hypothetical protein